MTERPAPIAHRDPGDEGPIGSLPAHLAGPADDYAYAIQLMHGYRVVSQLGGTTWGRMPTAQEVEDDLVAMLDGFIVRTLGGNLAMLRGGRIAFAFGSSADLMATTTADQLAAAEARAAALTDAGRQMVRAIGDLDDHFGHRGSTAKVATRMRAILDGVDAWERIDPDAAHPVAPEPPS